MKISCRRFSNICEIIGGSVDINLNKEVVLLNSVDPKCNCNRASKLQEDKYAHGVKSRNKCIIYKSTCTTMDKYYVCTT